MRSHSRARRPPHSLRGGRARACVGRRRAGRRPALGDRQPRGPRFRHRREQLREAQEASVDRRRLFRRGRLIWRGHMRRRRLRRCRSRWRDGRSCAAAEACFGFALSVVSLQPWQLKHRLSSDDEARGWLPLGQGVRRRRLAATGTVSPATPTQAMYAPLASCKPEGRLGHLPPCCVGTRRDARPTAGASSAQTPPLRFVGGMPAATGRAWRRCGRSRSGRGSGGSGGLGRLLSVIVVLLRRRRQSRGRAQCRRKHPAPQRPFALPGEQRGGTASMPV
jgi:hypothetical protein